MKLLAMRLCEHDANLSLYDDGKIRYIKTERKYQHKHHAYSYLELWKQEVKTLFDIDHTELDEIAIVVDPKIYGYTNPRTENLAEPFRYILAKCPVWKIEHHYAHSMSAWMLEDTDYQFVSDAYGEWYDDDIVTTYSVFKDGKRISKSQSLLSAEEGLGFRYHGLAADCGIKSDHYMDDAGKLMSWLTDGTYYPEFGKTRSVLDLYDKKEWETFANENGIDPKDLKSWAKCAQTDTVDHLVKWIEQYATPEDSILFTGGCAQNIYWNTELKKRFPKLVVHPHSADDGLSLGALKWLMDKHDVKPQREGFPYWQEDDAPDTEPTDETIHKVAQYLADGKIVGWYQGHGEVGPRALGNRSILMNPVVENGKDIINSKVKHRESYRPFGATVLKEHAKEYFDVDFDNPFMLYLSDVKQKMPEITHTDGTCRHQTLGNENPLYRKLIEEFYQLTGYPLLLNTSLNVSGKPIAGTKEEALKVFNDTELDVLVYGNEVYVK